MDNIVVKTKEAVDLLTRMIEIPSFSREEGAVADLVFDKLQKDGLEPHRIGNNVWCVDPYYDALKPTILLDAHLDTVKACFCLDKKSIQGYGGRRLYLWIREQ